jgi:uncharacterized repeat protein (TIGR01451 family)
MTAVALATVAWTTVAWTTGASAQNAAPAPTPAGSVIVNVADLQMSVAGAAARVNSNVSRQPVAELLDVRLTSAATSVSIGSGPVVAVPTTLVNEGNGSEAFVLDLSVDGSGAIVEGIALDRDGDGRFDPTIDLLIPSGTATPPLAAGATVQILALLRGDGSASTGSLVLSARAVTGSGVPGTTFAGQGDTGVDAVVGKTIAAARVERPFVSTNAGVIAPEIGVVKSQRVAAPDGSATPIVGAVITYSIAATFGGGGIAPAARLADTVPSGTAYVAGSLRLDGVALTDIADADGGSFDGTAVAVVLGDVPTPATHTVQFEVTIL